MNDTVQTGTEATPAESEESPRMPYTGADLQFWAWKSRIDELGRVIAEHAEASHRASRERLNLLGSLEARTWLTDLSDDEQPYYRKGL